MKKSKGFTFIEISMSLLIGSMLLQTLLGFYMQLYKENQNFNHQVALRNEAYNIENYLRLYIRQAEKIRILTTKGSVIEPALDSKDDIIKESLSSITLDREVQNEKKTIQLILEPNDLEKEGGEKKLYYYGNANIISYCIKDIQVTYLKNIEEVTFICYIHHKNDPNQLYTLTFTESIAHKKAYE